MSYQVSYKGLSRDEADAYAIADIHSFLSHKQWEAALALAAAATDFDQVAFGLSIAGVRGYPVHAFGRAYCLEPYRAWLRAGPEPVQTDARGFPLPRDFGDGDDRHDTSHRGAAA